MTLPLFASAVAWLAVLAGLLLASFHVARRRAPVWLAWLHPVAATLALVCLWLAVAFWPGANDLLFNAGAFVLTLAFVAGAFMFSLRVSGLPLPLLAITLHGAAAMGGCVLLIVGLLRVAG